MAAPLIDIDTLDFAVEDLLRVEVTYGRLQLVLKAVLDKLRSQTEALSSRASLRCLGPCLPCLRPQS